MRILSLKLKFVRSFCNMTQEDKELLIKDLCARLPYGVVVNVKGFDFDFKDKLTQIYNGYGCSIQVTNNMPYGIEQVKPYLFPMSSMTEEQKRDYQYITERWMNNPVYSISDSFDWLNRNHFDYRNLIEKSLALDATGLGIY